MHVAMKCHQHHADSLAAEAARINRETPGASATRSSVLLSIVEARFGAPPSVVRDAHTAPPITYVGPAVPTDAERLRAAMLKAGGEKPLTTGDVERDTGAAKGTVGQVLSGARKLAVASGGSVLAWVESVERGAAGSV